MVRRRSSRRPLRAFTLVEVMVAMTVMAIGVTMLLTALAQSSDNIVFARDHDHAVRMAEGFLNAYRHAEELEPRRDEGEEGRFVWTTWVEEATDEYFRLKESEKLTGLGGRNLRLALMKIEVLVRWRDTEDGPLGHEVRLVTYRAKSLSQPTENPFTQE